ncbi:lytic murein transglycosylase [Acetobacter sp. LMG 1636]|uniref:Lytic murein transglycosylase n=1 Tax=Acetobacter fallax TaxID=1737473 RepID=A0ABX0K5I5_9PROT|nr:lytic murein transglycosylase [Acetobacter fallax]NHO31017.1 lytic murein transglycosylase [Acetobacter fallax]NHO34574.1 lytic murein transglycosylase [Acetobacter fallax]
MIGRRAAIHGLALAGVGACLVPAQGRARQSVSTGPASAGGSYVSFLAGVRSQAVGMGIAPDIAAEALALTREPNAKVLKLDRHQPEFTLTWAQYRARVISQGKIDAGRAALAANGTALSAVESRAGVDRQPVMGIWGLESFYGRLTGSFNVVDALATLAYDGRRSAFFRAELLKALKILNERRIIPAGMTGSYAGAMGQPQFMPSAYLQYAKAFDGSARADIWKTVPDVMMSIANYLARCGWRSGEPWGQEIQVPDSLAQGDLGREHTRTLAAWMQAGVKRLDGTPFTRADIEGAVLRPDGPGGQAFMVYHNFGVIRRYNPSDYYALGVGLMGNLTI